MANGIATAFIAGNLTRDPELNDSGKVLKFSVAVNRREKQQDSEEWGEVADFHDVKVLGNRAGGLAPLLLKGDKVSVVGDLVQERWQDKESGGNRSKHVIIAREVVLSGGKKNDAPLRDDAPDVF